MDEKGMIVSLTSRTPIDLILTYQKKPHIPVYRPEIEKILPHHIHLEKKSGPLTVLGHVVEKAECIS